MTTLPPTELADLASRVFGPGWQSALARDRGVAVRTVQRWAKDGISKPETAEAIRAYLQSRTVVSVPAAPSVQVFGDGETRSILTEAMRRIAAEIVVSSKAAGWSEEEARHALSEAVSKRTGTDGK
ncbi:MAG: hypothetical protein GW854_01695 [Erythrobacter sp.]|nr:hypothetical protein [Erythrobacter sp.]